MECQAPPRWAAVPDKVGLGGQQGFQMDFLGGAQVCHAVQGQAIKRSPGIVGGSGQAVGPAGYAPHIGKTADQRSDPLRVLGHGDRPVKIVGESDLAILYNDVGARIFGCLRVRETGAEPSAPRQPERSQHNKQARKLHTIHTNSLSAQTNGGKTKNRMAAGRTSPWLLAVRRDRFKALVRHAVRQIHCLLLGFTFIVYRKSKPRSNQQLAPPTTVFLSAASLLNSPCSSLSCT